MWHNKKSLFLIVFQLCQIVVEIGVIAVSYGFGVDYFAISLIRVDGVWEREAFAAVDVRVVWRHARRLESADQRFLAYWIGRAGSRFSPLLIFL